jgi:hypothetical protein
LLGRGTGGHRLQIAASAERATAAREDGDPCRLVVAKPDDCVEDALDQAAAEVVHHLGPVERDYDNGTVLLVQDGLAVCGSGHHRSPWR